MSRNAFTPNLASGSAGAPVAIEQSAAPDKLSNTLVLVVRSVVVGWTFLLPLFFLPGLWASLGFQKTLLTIAVITVIVCVLSLVMLRQRSITTVVPLPYVVFFGFTCATILSALFSDNLMQATRGSLMEIGTVAFTAVLFAAMGLPLVLQQSKRFVLYTIQSLVMASVLLLSYIVMRLFLGPVWAFGSFNSVISSPLGGFNDMAVFAGLFTLVSLVLLAQLPLRTPLQWILVVGTTMSLLVLAVINFRFIWLVIGFFGLLMLLYLVTKDYLFTLDATATKTTQVRYSFVVATTLVCLVSAWFIVVGTPAVERVSGWFNVEYLEVRPSFTTTLELARSVYEEDWLLGIGPNQFVSSWRLFKDPGINAEPVYWSANFFAGSSYISTIAVTTGVAGVVLLLLFHAWYLWFGFRMLLRVTASDSFWYAIGVVSFAMAVFLWFMSYVYVPGPAILLLAALTTGLSFVASSALVPSSQWYVPLVTSRPRGFGLMALAILCICGSVGVLFTAGEQYNAHAAFNQAQRSATSVAEIDQAAAAAYAQYQDDQFLQVRARIALLEISQLMNNSELSEAEQQTLAAIYNRGVTLTQEAIRIAPTNPEHHTIQAGIYNNLAVLGASNALPLATSSLAVAESLDPHNPTYALVGAQLAVRRGDVETARQELGRALSMKGNFTEALFLLSQIDIAEGNIESAISATEAIIRLEPNNPTRFYQLGQLLVAAEQLDQAGQAFTFALNLDPQHANARYDRALLFANAGEVDLAISELRLVQETNQENELLASVIEQLESDTPIELLGGEANQTTPVSELEAETVDGTVTGTVAPETDLLTPLNTVRTETASTTSSDIDATTATVDSETDPVTAEDLVDSE